MLFLQENLAAQYLTKVRKLQKDLEDAEDRAETAESALNKARSRARASGAGAGGFGRQASREVSRPLSPSHHKYNSYPSSLHTLLSPTSRKYSDKFSTYYWLYQQLSESVRPCSLIMSFRSYYALLFDLELRKCRFFDRELGESVRPILSSSIFILSFGSRLVTFLFLLLLFFALCGLQICLLWLVTLSVIHFVELVFSVSK